MGTWDEAALRYGADKASSHHDYMHTYEQLLAGRTVERLFEIGVAGGRSMALWHELFPEALIVGIDILDECRIYQRKDIAVIIADAADPAKMAAIHTLHGPFDVIIDDGTHRYAQVSPAFEELFPRIATPGIYIVEDLDGEEEWVQKFVAHWHGTFIDIPDRIGYATRPGLVVFERP